MCLFLCMKFFYYYLCYVYLLCNVFIIKSIMCLLIIHYVYVFRYLALLIIILKVSHSLIMCLLFQFLTIVYGSEIIRFWKKTDP